MIFHYLDYICPFLLLIIFPTICASIHTPPRSPSPVSLEPLFNHEYWNPFEEPTDVQHALSQHIPSQDSSLQHVRSGSVEAGHANVVNDKLSNVPPNTMAGKMMMPRLKNTLSTVNKPRKKGRVAYLTVEQKKANALERSRRWKKERLQKDPDYLNRQAREQRQNRRLSLGLPVRKVGRPPKMQYTQETSNV
ncbi:uncharacterized protein FA14DRAFT_183071 [Meira miltonrushii]|uniref:BZIP domain-containing protein n=1 Tax=Meira miltonrushii TaxID=1280837 RepID=A0A316VH11_9BASI|nr:uncharacterized protein FA14DRAFT_183071 [Meira miltonrushii]PWN36534.1 hypothetical protein FA14DRAFT_183071 [Meira miltonrushii]